MHGEVGAPLGERVLELLHEQALAPGLIEAPVEDLVAARGQRQQLDREPGVQRFEALLDVLRPATARAGFAAWR